MRGPSRSALMAAGRSLTRHSPLRNPPASATSACSASAWAASRNAGSLFLCPDRQPAFDRPLHGPQQGQPMNEREAFLKAVLADPSEANRLPFADWVEDHGEGELAKWFREPHPPGEVTPRDPNAYGD